MVRGGEDGVIGAGATTAATALQKTIRPQCY